MNFKIYRFELKAQFYTFLIWTAVLSVSFLAFMSAIFPAFLGSYDDVAGIISAYPPEFAAAFGFQMENLFSYEGFYSFSFSYIAMMGAIMASALGLSAFAREKRSKCSDFLFTKPVTREKIFASKLLSSLTYLVIANLIYIAVCMVAYSQNSSDSADGAWKALIGTCALFLTQLVFFALSIALAVFAKRIRTVSGIATAFGFGGFLLMAIANIIKEEIFYFLSPYRYFSPADVFENGFFEPKYVIFAALLITAGILGAFWKYCRTDAHAV